MSVHTEWDTATDCGIELLDAATAEEELTPDDEVSAPYVLVLGGAGGGCLAVEGSREGAAAVRPSDHRGRRRPGLSGDQPAGLGSGGRAATQTAPAPTGSLGGRTMSDTLTIVHTPESGTLLEGTRKGDGAIDAIRAAGVRGWKWSRNIGAGGAWYVVQSRDRAPDLYRIRATATALRAAGWTVTEDVTTAPRAMEQAEADRAERLGERADALAGRAERKTAESAARDAAARQVLDFIPMGQPILVGHHSERRHRAALDRVDRNLRASLEAEREARRAAHYAATSARYMDRREAPGVTGRRVERLEAEQRKITRELEGYTRNHLRHDGTVYYVETHGPATGLHREQLEIRADYVAEELRYWRGVLDAAREAGQIGTVDIGAIRKGDRIRSRGRWYVVVRVNKTTVSVETGYSWTDKVKHRDIVEHRPAAESVVPAEV